MKKKFLLKNILGITTSSKSNEFVIHEKFDDSDTRFDSLRKIDLLSTIAHSFYKLTGSKLKFSLVDNEKLSDFVTSKSQKKDNLEFTLMKNDTKYFEDLFPKEVYETPGKDDDENQNLNDLGKNLSNVNEKNNLEKNDNPFTNVLIGGAVATGAGIGAVAGSIVACLAFDSIFLIGAAGEILGAGVLCLGGIAATGIGLIVAIPSLIGFGIYQIYKLVKSKQKKEFLKDMGLDKMKPEMELQNLAIAKIDKYFSKRIIINQKQEIEKYINAILDIYNKIDDEKMKSYLEKDLNKELIKKLNKDGSILSKNIPKIRQELMKKILSLQGAKKEKIFDESIPFFKEFIKNFGPKTINEKYEKKIDNYINKIIDIMKKVLEEMKHAFKSFEPKTFINNFDLEINKFYEEKSQLDEKNKNDFIKDCIDYIIEPIAENSVNYGILSLLFKFTLIVQEIGVNQKMKNYNKSRNIIKENHQKKLKEIEYSKNFKLFMFFQNWSISQAKPNYTPEQVEMINQIMKKAENTNICKYF